MGAYRSWGQRLRIALLAVVLAAVLGFAGWRYAIHWRPSLERYPLQGADVGAASGAIDWFVVRAGGADFAYITTVDAAGRRDPRFADNWAGAHAAGLRRGALHLFSPCRPGAAQANAFIITVPRVQDALPAAVAVAEDAACPAPEPTRLIAELTAFVRAVERHTGKPMLVQVSRGLEAHYDLSRALDRPLWATGSFLTPGYLGRPWRMWRANADRRIDGAEGPVGWDVVAP